MPVVVAVAATGLHMAQDKLKFRPKLVSPNLVSFLRQ